MPLEILARSHSADPKQEALRERKQSWNHACSEFIAQLNAFKPHLISFKKGLNGRGDTRAGLPISNIKDPLPNEVNNYLGSVKSEFLELSTIFSGLVGEAAGIIQEQRQYSQGRKKSQKLPQHRQAKNNTNQLIVEGSNPLTRLWANVSSIFSSDPIKKQRLSMLSMAHRLFQNLVDFEDAILERGVNNVPSILNYYFLIQNNVSVLNLASQKLTTSSKEMKNSIEQSQPDNTSKPEEPQTDKSNDTAKQQISSIDENNKINPEFKKSNPFIVDENTPLENLKRNIVLMRNIGIGFTDKEIGPFLKLFHDRKKEKDLNLLEITEDRLRQIYLETFDEFKEKVEDVFKIKLPSNADFVQVFNLITRASNNNIDIIKNSGNPLSRIINKYRHQFGLKEPSSAARMEIYDHIKLAKKDVDLIMNILEDDDFDLSSLNDKISTVSGLIIKMSEPLNILNILYKDKYYEKNRQYKDPSLDPASRYFTRQVKRDVDRPGW